MAIKLQWLRWACPLGWVDEVHGRILRAAMNTSRARTARSRQHRGSRASCPNAVARVARTIVCGVGPGVSMSACWPPGPERQQESAAARPGAGMRRRCGRPTGTATANRNPAPGQRYKPAAHASDLHAAATGLADARDVASEHGDQSEIRPEDVLEAGGERLERRSNDGQTIFRM